MLASQGLTREYFESEQRTQMEIRQFEDGIVSSSFFTPSEFRRYIELLAESREASLLTIDPAEIAETISLEEADIEAFYAANEASFTLPESVSLEYIEIRLADMESEVTVDEQRFEIITKRMPTCISARINVKAGISWLPWHRNPMPEKPRLWPKTSTSGS